jgi:predicted LPLAT superfamily acyltransferase
VNIYFAVTQRLFTALHILMEYLSSDEELLSCNLQGALRDILGDYRRSISDVVAYLFMYVLQSPFNWQNIVHL